MDETEEKRSVILKSVFQVGLVMAVAFAVLVGLKHGDQEHNQINFAYFMKALPPALILFLLLGYFDGVNRWKIMMNKRAANEVQLPATRKQMEDDKLFKFELPKADKLLYKYYHIGALSFIVAFFILLVSIALIHQSTLINAVEIPLIFCGSLYLLALVGVYRIWHNKVAFELIIDKENKKFGADVPDRKEEDIVFFASDVQEVWKHPTQDQFRFFLNDGTWITCVADGTDQGQLIEELIKSLGVSIRIKSFW